MTILLDAGPSLNFLAVGQENILIQAARVAGAQLASPERVDLEVEGKCRDPRFARTRAWRTWTTLRTAGRLEILSDELVTARFTDAVTRISGMPAAERVRSKPSLGEIMVLAHASDLAQEGCEVFVLLDEKDGRRRARDEIDWLKKQCAAPFILWSTPQLVRQAGDQPGWIKGDLTWQRVYDRMRPFDDGLPPLSELIR